MKKLIIAITALCVAACGGTNTSSHSHEAHDHSAHSNEAHDHSTHSHEAHDHSAHSNEAHDHSAHSHEGHEHNEGEITFTAHEASLGSFATQKVNKGHFHPVIKTAGKIITTPQGATLVTAPTTGIVKFNSNTTRGTMVKAGNSIMRIATDDTAGASAAEIEAQYHLWNARMQRADSLIIDRIISQDSYDDTRAQWEKARKAYIALNKKSSTEMTVKSPITGFIKELSVGNGDYVERGATLFEVVKNTRARLEIDVPQKYFNDLSHVTSAVFITTDGKKYDTASLGGKVITYSKSVSASGLLSLTIEYDSTGDIPEGAFTDVYLRLDSSHDAICVPTGAITEEQGEYFVYVQTCSESYRKQPVQIGMTDGIQVEVKSGLKAGETVVTVGTYRVKLAGNTGAIPHSHEH
ncbi:MAG: efflux RND transporter periplasmic adaptor subunit [Flavobacteriales bacterium]|nr:efflux RND transporter periplasmic adaptor subunit [Flavobacteriales bacterium]